MDHSHPCPRLSQSLAFVPVLEALEPDNAQNPCPGTYHEVQERHAAKPEQVPETRNVQDKEQADKSAGKDPDECFILRAQAGDNGIRP